MKSIDLTNTLSITEAGFVTKAQLDQAITQALAQVAANIEYLQGRFPEPSAVNGQYATEPNTNWTNGFWPGMLWLSNELSNKPAFKAAAEAYRASFKARIDQQIALETHDIGFLYTTAAVSDYLITQDQAMRQLAIAAADQLLKRVDSSHQFIQAWGAMDDASEHRLIVDSLMNIPLLFWASKETGDPQYAQIAQSHYHLAVDNLIRADGGTFHTFYFDQAGKPLRGATKQGYADDSLWARGQAWAMYGTALHYRYCRDPADFARFEAVTNVFINHLPVDHVPYWDLIFGDGAAQSRDSSAAAIAICGIHEMMKYLPEQDGAKRFYQHAMHAMLGSLIQNYTPKTRQAGGVLLAHGVYSYPDHVGIDEGNLWGDYFYLEALTRFAMDWPVFW